MSTTPETRFDPSALSEVDKQRLQQALQSDFLPVLLSKGGDVVELPQPVNDLFIEILQAVRRKEAVFLIHEDEAFTTQAAADYMGVSRQFFVRLLEDGKLPFHRVGTHRRVLFKDLIAYRQARSGERRAKLDKMTEELVEADLDAQYVDLTRPDPGRK
ncbi:glr1722 [Gloeobacter violaceus PCC 7421]|uniref:Glr1722 protein n=2 Tax=Gloeobacter violaceus TaxID=33072 RepID=Q7NJV9_GLOVI|nr:glr1722 [Gloeobacter violaceus PCC 7421]